jgi:beta-glucosidase
MTKGKENDRVQQLLDEMDWDAKFGQISQIDVTLLVNGDSTDLLQDSVDYYIGELGIGSVLNTFHKPWTTEAYRKAAIIIQYTAKRYNRPPVIWGLDSVHGANYLHGRIITPQPINLAASFNRTLAHQAGVWASHDTREAGINWLFSPLLGIAWEPKWSRVYETFGEDPFLVGEMALEMIHGIQTPDNTTIPSRSAACAKHWVGYSLPYDGHDRAPSWIPTRHLYQYFLPPWQKVLGEVDTVMESYTEIAGVPNVANRETMDTLLRHRLGFDGVVVTDYNEIFNLNTWHDVAKNKFDSVLQAMQEGTVDMSMIPSDAEIYIDALSLYHEKGEIFDERIDASVKRILQLKEDLNMFDEELSMVEGKDRSDEDLAHALYMTTQSIILAKNEGHTLPLIPTGSLKVLVTGPTSNSLSYQSGGWTWQWQGVDPKDESDWFTYGSTVYGAAQQEHAWDVSFRCGVNITGGDCDEPEGQEASTNVDPSVLGKVKNWIGWDTEDAASFVSIERAVTKAKAVDVVVVCVGEESYAEKPGDIDSLRLARGQYELIEGLRKESNAKIVLVYFGGRPRLLARMVVSTRTATLHFAFQL